MLRVRSLPWWKFYFRGKKCPKMDLKINWSVKTPGYGLTLCYIYDQLLVPWKRDLLIFILSVAHMLRSL